MDRTGKTAPSGAMWRSEGIPGASPSAVAGGRSSRDGRRRGPAGIPLPWRLGALALAFALGASVAAPCKTCQPRTIEVPAKAPPEQKTLVQALLTYYDALNRKDFDALKGLLDPSRTADTAPAPAFNYRSFLGWRRLRIYATEILKADAAAGQVSVRETVESESYNGAFFVYNSPAAYTFKPSEGRLLLAARDGLAVDRDKTKDLYELSFLFRDTLYRGTLDAALPYLDRWLAQEPSSYYALVMKGASLIQKGEHAAALPILEKAAALSDSKKDLCTMLGSSAFEAQLHDSLGVCRLVAKDVEGARGEFALALQLNPIYIPSLTHLAEAEAAQGKEAEARGYYYRAYTLFQDLPSAEIALFGNPAYGNNQVGMAYLKDNRLDDAATMLLQAIQESPNYDKPYNNLGLVRERQGKMEEAVRLYRKAIELNPRSTAILLNLASVYQKMGERNVSLVYLENILEMDPENLAALNLKRKM